MAETTVYIPKTIVYLPEKVYKEIGKLAKECEEKFKSDPDYNNRYDFNLNILLAFIAYFRNVCGPSHRETEMEDMLNETRTPPYTNIHTDRLKGLYDNYKPYEAFLYDKDLIRVKLSKSGKGGSYAASTSEQDGIAMRFQLRPKMLGKVVPVEIDGKDICENYLKSIERKKQREGKNVKGIELEDLERLTATLHQLEVDLPSAVTEGRRLLEDVEQMKFPKYYRKKDKEKEKKKERKKIMAGMKNLLMIRDKEIYLTRSKTTGRVFHPYINMKKELRQYVRLAGAPLQILDISNAQSYFLIAALNPMFYNKSKTSEVMKENSSDLSILPIESSLIKLKKYKYCDLKASSKYLMNVVYPFLLSIYYPRASNEVVYRSYKSRLKDLYKLYAMVIYNTYLSSEGGLYYMLSDSVKSTMNKGIDRYIKDSKEGSIVYNIQYACSRGAGTIEDDEKVKDNLMKIYNGKGKVDTSTRDAFRSNYPAVDYILQITKYIGEEDEMLRLDGPRKKGRPKGKDYNKEKKIEKKSPVARLLQSLESYLMIERCLKRIYKEDPDIHLILTHDGIATTPDKTKYIEEVIKEEGERFIGYAPNLKTEPVQST